MEDNSQLLKFEMVAQGTLRALIIKNCVASDFGKYEAVSGEERVETIFREESEAPAAVRFMQKISLKIYRKAPVSKKPETPVTDKPKESVIIASVDAVVVKNVPKKVFAQEMKNAEAQEGQIAVFETKERLKRILDLKEITIFG